MFNKIKRVLNKKHIRTTIEENESCTRVTHRAGLFHKQVSTTFNK